MNTKKRGDNVTSLHDDDFEITMWEHAIDNGMFIPTTVEEVEKMEELLKDENLVDEASLPDVDMILARDIGASFDGKAEDSFNMEELYGIAARKGQAISEKAKEKMERLKNSDKKKT